MRERGRGAGLYDGREGVDKGGLGRYRARQGALFYVFALPISTDGCEQAEEVLCLKFRQHPALYSVLVATEDAELIYVEPNDPFWGGDELDGRNELGQVLMRVRERIMQEGLLPPKDD